MKNNLRYQTIVTICLYIFLTAVMATGCRSKADLSNATPPAEEQTADATEQASDQSDGTDAQADEPTNENAAQQTDELTQLSEQAQPDEPPTDDAQAQPDEPPAEDAEPQPSEVTEPQPSEELILTEPVTKTDYMLGTVCSVRMYDSRDEKILDKAFARIAELEKLISSNDDGTEIDAINLKAGIEPVSVSSDTYSIIVRALEYAKMSEGHFDPTIGPIVGLWRIGFSDARVPSQEEIADKLKYVNYRNVVVNSANRTIFLKEAGMKLDLGGIAKGFIADEVAKVLSDNGVKRAIIDLGGNVLAMGTKNNESPWTIGVQNPLDNRGEALGAMKIENQAVITSGVYERYLVYGGVNYHHILSPFNGYPFNNELAGVTIISDLSMDGDALSTTVFTYGLEKGMEFVESLDGVDAVFVTHSKKVYISSGLVGDFRIIAPGYTLY